MLYTCFSTATSNSPKPVALISQITRLGVCKTGTWVLSLYVRNPAALGAALAGGECVAAPTKLLVIKVSTATP
ncbi:hypothetical protein I79_002501 [Cricetulus griseus]|uniref:Uncharacterized protein n=1 Tax=Cricetulus griseus TaxID=10029 RepID=G3GXK9_CRIGR|nr:hypothetical protein I79_002501 [Cricetulus griseus]